MGSLKIPWPANIDESLTRRFERKYRKLRKLLKEGNKNIFHEQRNREGYLIIKWR